MFNVGDRVFYLESMFDNDNNMLLHHIELSYGTITRVIRHPTHKRPMKYEINTIAGKSLSPYDCSLWDWYYYDSPYVTGYIDANYVFKTLEEVKEFIMITFNTIKTAIIKGELDTSKCCNSSIGNNENVDNNKA